MLKLSRKKGQKTLPMNKTHNTLEKMRSWKGGRGAVATKTDKVVFLSFFFNKKSLKNKQTNKKQNKRKRC